MEPLHDYGYSEAHALTAYKKLDSMKKEYYRIRWLGVSEEIRCEYDDQDVIQLANFMLSKSDTAEVDTTINAALYDKIIERHEERGWLDDPIYNYVLRRFKTFGDIELTALSRSKCDIKNDKLIQREIEERLIQSSSSVLLVSFARMIDSKTHNTFVYHVSKEPFCSFCLNSYVRRKLKVKKMHISTSDKQSFLDNLAKRLDMHVLDLEEANELCKNMTSKDEIKTAIRSQAERKSLANTERYQVQTHISKGRTM